MFVTETVDKIQTHIFTLHKFFPKIVPFMRQGGKIF